MITGRLTEDGRLMFQMYNRGGPLNRGLISHCLLQLFRGIDYWPLNEDGLLIGGHLMEWDDNRQDNHVCIIKQ